MNQNGLMEWDLNGKGEMFLVDKPLDWTSFDVVKKIRSLFNVKKAGHAGTLDPHATGLLIICTGKKTKTISGFVDMEKEYTGTFELGIRTASFDSETPVTERKDFASVSPAILHSAVLEFIGELKQQPPMYSAAKYGGKPLYEYAREGRTVIRADRDITVTRFDITGFAESLAEFRVICSKGTYVRSLVDDLGQKLGCGASLRSLRRTRIGGYRVEEALSIDRLIELQRTQRLPGLPGSNDRLQYEAGVPA